MNTASSSSPTALNGHAPTNGSHQPEHPYEDDSAISLPPSNGCSQTLYQLHNEEIINHLYHAGFQAGNYADTILHVRQNSYRLHAIILSRSPFLAHLMSTSPQTGAQRVIYVHLDHEPEVTHEGFAIALGYLYSPVSVNLIRPENARGVLAAGCLLGGMEDLCGYAYGACRQSINVETISEWLEFIDTIPLASDGSPTPRPHLTSVFGQYAGRLREDVFHFLAVTLPSASEISSESGSSQGRDTLLHVFSLAPFDIFKAAVESPTFQIGSDQCRFKFAKDAIELRKRGIARGHGSEETVVLAFGGGHMSGSAVHVTRKTRKRPLWKAVFDGVQTTALLAMSRFKFKIYFSGRDDPRDACIVIGEDTKPVFFEFETAVVAPCLTRTTISSNRHPVAALDWDAHGNRLGSVTIGDREGPMEHLVLPGASPGARRFQAADGRVYEWRRRYRDSESYELFMGPNTPPIAAYCRFAQATPIGPSHGTLEYSFTDELFLLETLLTLNLNRWLDWNLT